MTKRLILYSILCLLGFRSQAQTLEVGSIDGVFNVSDLGGASYTIPIKIPDGNSKLYR